MRLGQDWRYVTKGSVLDWHERIQSFTWPAHIEKRSQMLAPSRKFAACKVTAGRGNYSITRNATLLKSVPPTGVITWT